MSISYRKITEMIEAEASVLASGEDITQRQLADLAGTIFMIESSVDGRSVQSKRESIVAEITRLASDIGDS